MIIRFMIAVAMTIAVASNARAANAWQGTWGDWSEKTGAYITLNHCTDLQCDYMLRTNDPKHGGGCTQWGRADMTAGDAKLTPSNSMIGDTFSPNTYGCSMQLHRKGNTLQADPAVKACLSYCTVSATFASSYKLASPKPYNDNTRCFTEKTAGRQAWCTNEDFAKKDHELSDMEIKIVEQDENVKFNDKFPEDAIAECDKAGDANACLLKKYAEARANVENAKANASKVAEQFAKDSATEGDTAKADALITKLEGVYKIQFDNGLVSGEKFKSENILEIVRVSKSSIYFKTYLSFFNGHECAIHGVAKFSALNAFTYKDDACQIAISSDTKNIKIDDHNGTCSEHCGARGSLSNVTFPLVKRRPIKYMKVLVNSDDYKSAIK